MKAKFVVYALLISLVSTVISWSRLTSSNTAWSSSRSGSTWSSSSGSWGGSGGGHK